MSSSDVIAGPASWRQSPPGLLCFHPLFSMTLLFLPPVSSPPSLILLLFSFLSVLCVSFWSFLSYINQRPVIKQKCRESVCFIGGTVSAAPPAKVTLIHLHLHHQLYFWRTWFHKSLFPRCSSPTFPPKRLWARCSDSAVFQNARSVPAGFPNPAGTVVEASVKHSNLLRPVLTRSDPNVWK